MPFFSLGVAGKTSLPRYTIASFMKPEEIFRTAVVIKNEKPTACCGLYQPDNLFQASNFLKNLLALLLVKMWLLQFILQGEEDHFLTIFVAGVLVTGLARAGSWYQ